MGRNINEMRTYICQHPKYKNSVSWRARVMTMPDLQVLAIYMQFRKLDYRKIEREMKRQEKDSQKYHQINMFEYMEGKV